MALTALVGGVVGGAVVALVGWATGWATHTTTSTSTCAVDVVASTALPSVVTLAVHGPSGSGTGSGVVINLGSGQDVILTNAHVVAPASQAGAQGGTSGGSGPTSVQVTYTDGHTTAGTIAGVDQVTDLAVVRPTEPDPSAPPIGIGDSGELTVGTPVVALGAPLGLSSTVTSGIVSATGRYVRVPTGTGGAHHLVGAIQTDAAINPGNSGGALVDCNARLVGINSAGAAPGGESGSVGLGFAIPMSLAEPLAGELVEHGRVSHPTLGFLVQPVPPQMQSSAGGPVVVQALLPDGPAHQAGMQIGDVVVSVGGQPIHSFDDLVALQLGLSVGQQVPVVVSRDGQQQTLTMTAAAS